MTADGFKKKVENIFRNRLGWAGLDDKMPLKRGLWGEPLKETPEGRSASIYQFFDVSKGQQITSDPKKLELYRLWRKTDNTRVIPTPPRASVTIQNKTYPLNPQLHERLSELVGKGRIDAHMRRAALELLNDQAVNPVRYHTAVSRLSIADFHCVSHMVIGHRSALQFGKLETGFHHDQRCVNYAIQRLRTALKNLHEVYNGRKRQHEQGIALDGYKVRDG